MTVPRDNVYVWVTWLSRLLVGDASCEWASWFKAHHIGHVRASRDFSLATWKMHHTRLLNDVRDRLEADGHTLSIERENWFNLMGASGAMIAGQPDLVAVAPDGQPTVYDIKTGAQRDSDVAQVMIYMFALPLTPGSRWKGQKLDGRLIYKDGTEKYIPVSAVDDDFREGLFDLIRRVVSDRPARRVPSPAECNWCDLTDLDCPERMESEVPKGQGAPSRA